MTFERFPVGLELDVPGPNQPMSLTLLSAKQLRLERLDGLNTGVETVGIHVLPLCHGLFAVSWREQSGAAVSQVQDFERGLVHSHTTLPGGEVVRTREAFQVRATRSRA